ncbi:GNAT family N-acetyltransferase [Allorhizobium undicola]|uniref:GNAT family N-acetyltransferase n=1 Tax=Allorhizobium undicola TaxID=78527 RepID=UPI000569167B|nr:GNAT family protein [Allorhizobium undicola]
MTRSVFRFLSRQPETPQLFSETHMLRLPRTSDYQQWYRLRSESRAFLQPWEPLWRADELTEASFRSRCLRHSQEHACGLSVPFFLFRRQDDALLGGLTIGLIRRGVAQTCMIGYWMGERFAGQGHMFAAVGMAIPYIFRELELHRIEAACIPENHKSIRLLERAGFEREGLLRSYLNINGEWRDHAIYSLLSPHNCTTSKTYYS